MSLILCDQDLMRKEAQKGEMTCPKSLCKVTILILQFLLCTHRSEDTYFSGLVTRLNERILLIVALMSYLLLHASY